MNRRKRFSRPTTPNAFGFTALVWAFMATSRPSVISWRKPSPLTNAERLVRENPVSCRMAFCLADPLSPRNSRMKSRTRRSFSQSWSWTMQAPISRSRCSRSYQRGDVGSLGRHFCQVGVVASVFVVSPNQLTASFRCGFKNV